MHNCSLRYDEKMAALHNRSFWYNEKMAAHTAMLAKKMEIFMSPYKFKDSAPVTILSYLDQSKSACDSNEVLRGVAMWLLSFFMAKSPAASSTIWFTPTNNDDALLLIRRKIE